MNDVSTSSSASFVNEHKMDNVFRVYENYVEKLLYSNDNEEESDVELSFEEDNIIDKLNLNNASNESQANNLEKNMRNFQKLINNQNNDLTNDFEDFFVNFKNQQRLDLQNDSIQKQIKPIENMKENEVLAFISEISNKIESYPNNIIDVLKYKLDKLLNDLKCNHEAIEERFQKRLNLLNKQKLKADITYHDKIMKLFDELIQKEKELDQVIEDNQILLEFIPPLTRN